MIPLSPDTNSTFASSRGSESLLYDLYLTASASRLAVLLHLLLLLAPPGSIC